MALNTQETEWLRTAAENSSANRQLLQTHSEQIKQLFETTAEHANTITVIGTKQDLCQKRNDPGNKAERAGVIVAILASLVSIGIWLVNSLT